MEGMLFHILKRIIQPSMTKKISEIENLTLIVRNVIVIMNPFYTEDMTKV